MAFDDGGIWNTIGVTAPQGTLITSISGLNSALTPTGVETLVQAEYNGQQLDWGLLRFLVR